MKQNCADMRELCNEAIETMEELVEMMDEPWVDELEDEYQDAQED